MYDSEKIRECIIEKAVFNGYDVKTVDELLDQIADDMQTLEKENAELRMKLKVLIVKIEEYRKIEDGLRQSLLSAQTIADDTTAKAKAEAEALLTHTRTEAEHIKTETAAQCENLVRQYHDQAVQAQANMRQAQQECAAFIERMTNAFREEAGRVEAIGAQTSLPTEPVPAQEPAKEAAAQPQVKAETMQGHVEGPVEPELAMTPDEKEPGEADDLTEVFSVEEIRAAQQAMEQKFTVEVSGSAQE